MKERDRIQAMDLGWDGEMDSLQDILWDIRKEAKRARRLGDRSSERLTKTLLRDHANKLDALCSRLDYDLACEIDEILDLAV